jgi:hypothetical protein
VRLLFPTKSAFTLDECQFEILKIHESQSRTLGAEAILAMKMMRKRRKTSLGEKFQSAGT